MVREDVQRASMGETSITDIGGGMYHIDSFFDVFTEVSIDGGGNWTASASSARMVLIPEPATLGLLAMGGLAVLRKRRKR